MAHHRVDIVNQFPHDGWAVNASHRYDHGLHDNYLILWYVSLRRELTFLFIVPLVVRTNNEYLTSVRKEVDPGRRQRANHLRASILQLLTATADSGTSRHTHRIAGLTPDAWRKGPVRPRICGRPPAVRPLTE